MVYLYKPIPSWYSLLTPWPIAAKYKFGADKIELKKDDVAKDFKK
jgi:hypothetical protein